MKDILTLRLYTRVAHLGSFSAAARECGMSQSQVSRVVADLEAGLGARLLSRTTRALALTEAGAEFLARIEPILAAIDDAENSVRETGELRGLLLVSMPSTMAARVVLPRLWKFSEQHPQLRVEIILEDRFNDMVREAIDVGMRVGNMPDITGTARLVGHMSRVIVASPAYLSRHGTPQSPDDILTHRVVAGPASPVSWQFERDGFTSSIAPRATITTNDTAGAIAAAVGGLGVTSTTSWACRDELARGELVQLLGEWHMAKLPVHAYFPLGRATRMPARAFVEFIASELSPLDEGSTKGS
ncbi:LysR family transcriptional regulator [Dyella soli]|uniref:LysR family transcriptional regulator n=1 Tax=Dyella soli TaxID=522319 RepID=A0A4R0YQW3_9GAMM|nr:LysR family transcriptional regulator [Dyella soli]